jgi:hypothetical protein
MRASSVFIGLGLAAIVAGCGGFDEREWMKVDQKYTAEEFRRDYRECSKGGKLDEDCMRSRGWVAVTPPKSEPKAPDPLAQPAGRGGRR